MRVPQPILHERDSRTGVQQTHRNRVAQRMKPPLGVRHRCDLTMLRHQVPIRPAFPGETTGGDQQGGRVILACLQRGSQAPQVVRLQGRGVCERAFDPRDVKAAVLRVHGIALEQRHFGGPSPVMRGQLQEDTVALARDDRKQPAHLILGEKGDCREGWSVLVRRHASDSIRVMSTIILHGLQSATHY